MEKGTLKAILIQFLLFGGFGGICTLSLGAMLRSPETTYFIDDKEIGAFHGAIHFSNLDYFFALCVGMVLLGLFLLWREWRRESHGSGTGGSL